MTRTLYHFAQCPYCLRARIVLGEKGLNYTPIEVDPRDKPAALLTRNPRGKVPVYQEDDLVLYESQIISEYLDEQYPDPPLMPASAADRARVRLLIDYCDKELADAMHPLAVEVYLKPEDERDPTVLAEGRATLVAALAELESMRSSGDWAAGEFSLADCALAPRVIQLGQLGIDHEHVPAGLVDWIERLRRRPSIRPYV